MAVSISVSPIDLASLTGLSPVALQPRSTATTVTVTSLVTGTSTVVELSPPGLLASAASTFGDDLSSLLTAATDSSPTTVLDTATGLVDAFNTFQNRLQDLPTTTLPNVPNTAPTSSSLANLSTIGITVQNTAELAANLNIDLTTLTEAATTETASTQELLTEATQALLDQVSAFEETIAGTANTVVRTTAFTTPTTTATDTATTAAAETPSIATQPTTTTATATATTTLVAAANDEALAADIRAFAERLALQNLINDPARRAVDLVVDANYAAIIAATHLADFVSAQPVNDPTALASDTPGAVLPARPTTGISYPDENAGGTEAYRDLAQAKA